MQEKLYTAKKKTSIRKQNKLTDLGFYKVQVFQDKTWQIMGKYSRIQMHLPKDHHSGRADQRQRNNLDQRGRIQDWQEVRRQQAEYNVEVSRTVHKELWRRKWNNYLLHQTTATTTKLQTERPQSLWVQGQNTDRKILLIQEIEEVQIHVRGYVPKKRGRKSEKHANKTKQKTHGKNKENSVEEGKKNLKQH